MFLSSLQEFDVMAADIKASIDRRFLARERDCVMPNPAPIVESSPLAHYLFAIGKCRVIAR